MPQQKPPRSDGPAFRATPEADAAAQSPILRSSLSLFEPPSSQAIRVGQPSPTTHAVTMSNLAFPSLPLYSLDGHLLFGQVLRGSFGLLGRFCGSRRVHRSHPRLLEQCKGETRMTSCNPGLQEPGQSSSPMTVPGPPGIAAQHKASIDITILWCPCS